MTSMHLLFAANMALTVGQTLHDDTFATLRDEIIPAKEELAWRQSAWHPTLWEAVQRGRADAQPILLYAMNGHPLGCT